MGQHVHPLQPKVSPERFDVVHLPANKNIGTTHIANGAYRLHPVEWSIGEAAGALAAYCLDSGRTPAQVRRDDVRRFQDLLSGALGVPLAWPEEIRRHSPE
ncbi:FAD-dependent oxidoreductase [Nonomuraea aridisoli]|uniref:FAD-dependent oxidoreductase n=1 Tax=Nonomuraea aridisoli TaxID=2070368 RepID=UPI001F47AB0A|nr:FAD-dependent oxidoreductase [Nonomuraea aridisoli]